MMKIILHTQYYPPEKGAPQARLSSLAEAFVLRGHSVTVLTAMPSYPEGRIYPGYGGFFRKEDVRGVQVIRTPIYPAQSEGLLKRLFNYFSFVLASFVYGIFFLPKADYFFTESPPLFLGISGFLLSRWKRARWIFNVSDLWPDSAVRLGKLRAGGPVFHACSLMEAFFYQRAWLVTGQSREIIADISSRFPGVRTALFSNGADLEKFDLPPAARRQEVFPGIPNHPQKPCLALYAGLHGLAQGLEQILESASRTRHLPVHYVLAGDGPAKSALIKLAKDRDLKNVSFFDGRPYDRVPEMLAAADILMVPLLGTLPGAVPSKLYEAMAAAKPVILAAEGEAAGIVRGCGCGIVVKPKDTEQFVEAVEVLSRDAGLRKTMGDAGKAEVKKRYDRRKIQEEFIHMLISPVPS